jgi:ATP-dependent exoDNAse (exonuclease V) alpha subunit
MLQWKNPNYDFMQWRRVGLWLSSAINIAAIVSLFTVGLHFSIEFTGGTVLEVAYTEAADLGRTRTVVQSLVPGEVQVQNFGTSRDVLVIDEAGMVGTRQMERVLSHAADAGAKVVLVGDPQPLQAIEAGADPHNPPRRQAGDQELGTLRVIITCEQVSLRFVRTSTIHKLHARSCLCGRIRWFLDRDGHAVDQEPTIGEVVATLVRLQRSSDFASRHEVQVAMNFSHGKDPSVRDDLRHSIRADALGMTIARTTHR